MFEVFENLLFWHSRWNYPRMVCCVGLDFRQLGTWEVQEQILPRWSEDMNNAREYQNATLGCWIEPNSFDELFCQQFASRNISFDPIDSLSA